jgi:hypothetical protein
MGICTIYVCFCAPRNCWFGVCMHICMYIYIYICMYMYMYMYIFTCLHVSASYVHVPVSCICVKAYLCDALASVCIHLLLHTSMHHTTPFTYINQRLHKLSFHMHQYIHTHTFHTHQYIHTPHFMHISAAHTSISHTTSTYTHIHFTHISTYTYLHFPMHACTHLRHRAKTVASSKVPMASPLESASGSHMARRLPASLSQTQHKQARRRCLRDGRRRLIVSVYAWGHSALECVASFCSYMRFCVHERDNFFWNTPLHCSRRGHVMVSPSSSRRGHVMVSPSSSRRGHIMVSASSSRRGHIMVSPSSSLLPSLPFPMCYISYKLSLSLSIHLHLPPFPPSVVPFP